MHSKDVDSSSRETRAERTRRRETRAEFAGLTLLAEVALLAQVGGGRYTSAGLRENQIFACITKSVVRWNLPSRSVE